MTDLHDIARAMVALTSALLDGLRTVSKEARDTELA